MARELYNWDQVRAYAVIALNNVLNKNKDITTDNFIKELDPLQSLYGKDGVIGLANRIKEKSNKK